MEKSDCIKLMSFFLERHLLRLLVDEGTLTAEEYAGILQIAQTQGRICRYSADRSDAGEIML